MQKNTDTLRSSKVRSKPILKSELGLKFTKFMMDIGYSKKNFSMSKGESERTLSIKLYHKEYFDNETILKALKAFKAYSIDSRLITNNTKTFLEYELYTESLNELLGAFPNVNIFERPLLRNVIDCICHLDTIIFRDDFDDFYPYLFFRLIDNVMIMEFLLPNGEQASQFMGRSLLRHCVHPLNSKEDFEMALYLESLNLLTIEDRNALNIYDIIHFEGLEEFGYPVEDRFKCHQENWLKQTKNRQRLRSKRISNLF